MKTLLYPAVIYKESEYDGCVLLIPDVNLVTEADTVEDAMLDAKKCLLAYYNCVVKFDAILEDASTFETIQNKYKDKTVLMVDCEIND